MPQAVSPNTATSPEDADSPAAKRKRPDGRKQPASALPLFTPAASPPQVCWELRIVSRAAPEARTDGVQQLPIAKDQMRRRAAGVRQLRKAGGPVRGQ